MSGVGWLFADSHPCSRDTWHTAMYFASFPDDTIARLAVSLAIHSSGLPHPHRSPRHLDPGQVVVIMAKTALQWVLQHLVLGG